VFVMSMGLVAAIPLPLPFINLVAAYPLLLLGLSLLEKDLRRQKSVAHL